MELKRKPFQGVLNIVRFNWHFYLLAGIVLLLLILGKGQLPETIQPLVFWGVLLASAVMAISLIISFYIYDISNLYQLEWLPNTDKNKILNINAGFDEISGIIKNKYPDSDLATCDFYDPKKHTELSIKRARNAYPPHGDTIQISTDKLPFLDNFFDCTIAFLSTHEIRNKAERITFFRELNRITKADGEIYVTEHLRDLNNFAAYTIGFFHFHSKSCWLETFKQANLTVKREIKTTPFVTTFRIEKNGDTS